MRQNVKESFDGAFGSAKLGATRFRQPPPYYAIAAENPPPRMANNPSFTSSVQMRVERAVAIILRRSRGDHT
jgi:hypothetical protein